MYTCKNLFCLGYMERQAEFQNEPWQEIRQGPSVEVPTLKQVPLPFLWTSVYRMWLLTSSSKACNLSVNSVRDDLRSRHLKSVSCNRRIKHRSPRCASSVLSPRHRPGQRSRALPAHPSLQLLFPPRPQAHSSGIHCSRCVRVRILGSNSTVTRWTTPPITYICGAC